MRTAEDIVRTDVHYCVSVLIAELAKGYGGTNEELGDIAEAAFELSTPLEDWEESAIQEGWTLRDGALWNDKDNMMFGGIDSRGEPDWKALCEEHDIEPYPREIFEHWIVSDWLADRLAEKGERIDKDFCGLTVWGRTTTGQAIYADAVMEAIASDLNR